MIVKSMIPVLIVCMSLAAVGCERHLNATTRFAAQRKLAASNEGESRLLQRASGLFDAAKVGRKTIVVVGKRGQIFRSDDDGKVWHRVMSKTSQPLLSVAFSDPRHGVIVGAGGTYLESADSGSSWTAHPIGVKENLFSVRFFQHGAGFIVGAFGTLLETDNDGKSWRLMNLNWDKLLPKLTHELGLVQPHLYGVAFCDSQHGWIVGEYGLILGTDDGGRSWHRQAGGRMSDRQLFTIAAAGPGQAVAAGQGGEILYTDDYGRRWVAALPPDGRDIYGLSPFGNGDLLALGDLGNAFVSTDAGSPDSRHSINLARGGGTSLADSWLAGAVYEPYDGVLAFGQLGIWRLKLDPEANEPS